MKRHLTPDGTLNFLVELRPTLNLNEPNEIVVIFVTKVKDDDGTPYELRNVLSADDFKLFVRDVMGEVLEVQKEHNIKTKAGENPPPIIWKPGEENLN